MCILEDFLKSDFSNNPIKIAVVGDALLDQYFDVKVKRISPEFPISVMLSETDESKDFPGGAANVAYQFKNFNATSYLISFLDHAAELCLMKHDINTSLCLNIKNDIPRKRRFYSDDFPTYRWDIEKSQYGFQETEIEAKRCDLWNKTQNISHNWDAIIFSDYNKGVLSNGCLNLLIRHVPISVVDPKSNVDRWAGCTVFKPNAAEALSLTGCKSIKDAGYFLLKKLECKAVVITESGNGVSIFDESGIKEIRPTQELPPIQSQIGAGDCFTAFLTMAMVRGFTIAEAAEIAWNAGIMYVRNRHNKPLTRIDFSKSFDPGISKFVNPDELSKKNRKFKLVFANGCWDMLHCGHLETLKFAKQQGDKLVVAVNSDTSVAKLKPGRPIITLNERMKLLAALEIVDFIVSFDEETPLQLIEKIQPDILIKGSEYQVENVVGYEIVEKVITSPMIEGISTSKIIEKIKTI